MEKNYNYNYENRANTKSSANSGVSLGGLQMASCKSSDLKKQPVSNGRLWHTTDTNKFYYDWNGKRQELNVSGDNASLEAEIRKIKADMKNLNPDAVQSKLNQLETKVNNAASQANSAKNSAQTAKQEALAAAQQAQEAADSVASKASTDYVDEKVSHAFDNLTDAQKEELRGPAGAAGKDGKDGVDGQVGITPHIGTNGNWFIGDVDTDVKAEGAAGKDGVDGKDGKDGVDGQNGKSAYELAVEGGYQGTQAEWLESLKGEGLSQADRDLIDSLAEFGESDITAGTFPSGNNVEDVTAVDGGFATVQDVMDYVNALIEKKKDELGPADDKDYFYVNGVEAAVLPNLVVPDSPTSIYQMNQVEITDSILENGYEVYISPEANGYYAPDSPVDTIYSEVFSVYVPTGYTLKVYCYDEDTDDKWSTVEEPMVVHPKHATIQYGGKTYNCYARRSLSSADDEYAGIGEYSPYSGAYSVPTRYKIELSK